MRLDLMVAQAVAWAHVIERALHDHGPWTFQTEHGITPAHRIINRKTAEIVFHGVALGCSDRQPVGLYCGDDMITVTTADLSQGEQFTWKMLVTSTASTS